MSWVEITEVIKDNLTHFTKQNFPDDIIIEQRMCAGLEQCYLIEIQ